MYIIYYVGSLYNSIHINIYFFFIKLYFYNYNIAFYKSQIFKEENRNYYKEIIDFKKYTFKRIYIILNFNKYLWFSKI